MRIHKDPDIYLYMRVFFFLFGPELAQGGGNKVQKRQNEREVGKERERER